MPQQKPAEQQAKEPTDEQLLAAQEAVNYLTANASFRQPSAIDGEDAAEPTSKE